jgi:hypothetical protein
VTPPTTRTRQVQATQLLLTVKTSVRASRIPQLKVSCRHRIFSRAPNVHNVQESTRSITPKAIDGTSIAADRTENASVAALGTASQIVEGLILATHFATVKLNPDLLQSVTRTETVYRSCSTLANSKLVQPFMKNTDMTMVLWRS